MNKVRKMNMFLEFDYLQAGRKKGRASKSADVRDNREINFESLKREALVGLKLE